MPAKRTKKQLALIVMASLLAFLVVGGFLFFYLSQRSSIKSTGRDEPVTVNQINHITSLLSIGMSEKPIEALIVLQNDQELRASGGFITAVGRATIKKGQILGLDIQPGRAFEKNQTLKIPLDDSLSKLINTSYLTLRDANLSPDFATSMSNVLRFLNDSDNQSSPHLSQRPTLFVAVNSSANEKLLDLLGPLTFSVNRHEIRVDQNNVTDTLERLTDLDYAKLGLSKKDRKEILSEYAKALLPKLQRFTAKHPFKIVNLALTLVRNYDLQIWSTDPSIQRHLSALKTAQSLRPAPFGDLLIIVDSNFGSRKTDPFIEQKATYHVTVNNQRVIGQLSLDYKNTAKETALTTTYHDYLQIFVPANAKLIEQQGLKQVKSGRKLGLSTFSGIFSVKPGQAARITIKYELPLTTYLNDRPAYSLFFKRQSGGRVFPINYITSVDNNIISSVFDSAKDAQINLDKTF